MSWVWSWARVGIGCGGGRIGEGCLEQEASVCVWGKDHVAGTERGYRLRFFVWFGPTAPSQTVYER